MAIVLKLPDPTARPWLSIPKTCVYHRIPWFSRQNLLCEGPVSHWEKCLVGELCVQTLQHSNCHCCHFLPPQSAALRFSINYLLHLLHIMHIIYLLVYVFVNQSISIYPSTWLQYCIQKISPVAIGPGIHKNPTAEQAGCGAVAQAQAWWMDVLARPHLRGLWDPIQFSTCPAVSNWCLWWATELVLQGMPAQVKHGETSFAEQRGVRNR